MNKKEFKKNMQQGLGRCVITLQSSNNIEKYKDIVLWGCLHNLSYDTQCEGTRAAYVYKLTTFFDDKNYFLMPTIEKFEKLPAYLDWKFDHFCELLCKFAENGNNAAKEALLKKYDQLLSVLIKKRKFGIYDYERDNFERVCLTLFSLNGDAILEIIRDFGRLFKENPNYSCDDFYWFCFTIERQLGKKLFNAILKRESKKSENIRCFYESYLDSTEEPQNKGKSSAIETQSTEDIKNEVTSSGELSIASRVRFSNRAKDDEKIKLAKEAIEEENLDVKAELLSTFAYPDESFPFSYETIIEYSKSSHERLSEVAFEVLTNCQSKAVKDYAITLLDDEKHKYSALEMLLCNYTPNIKNLLLSELYKIEVDYNDKTDWHSVGCKILDVDSQGIRLPEEFFLYIYNTTLCSCCRENAIQALSKHHCLTRDIIEECRHDSNSDISQFVNRYYPAK